MEYKRTRRPNERGTEMRGEGDVAFHFEQGAFSTAGWLALNRQYYLLTLARVGVTLSMVDWVRVSAEFVYMQLYFV